MTENKIEAWDDKDLGHHQMVPSSINHLIGSVRSIHNGVTCAMVRLRVGQRLDLRVKWMSGSMIERAPQAGQGFVATISPNDVTLEAGMFRRGKERWNRWPGRIVLVDTRASEPLITVKIHGEDVILNSRGSVIGLDRAPQVWDTVNIVVDSTRVQLQHLDPRTNRPRAFWTEGAATMQTDSRVWMKGLVRGANRLPTGWLVALEIGTARVSALVGRAWEMENRLEIGVPMQVHVGQYEAWLKPYGMDAKPIRCDLLYPSEHWDGYGCNPSRQ
ncbi:MAG: hypothetical protein ACT4OO_14445 [Nitrospiraceae bacterium]